MMLTIVGPGGVCGSMSTSRRASSRLVKSSSDDDGASVRLGGENNSRTSTWRKLLQARGRRHPAAVGFTNPADEEVQGHAHFVAAYSFFSSMAKGSASPSPTTPSPGHN